MTFHIANWAELTAAITATVCLLSRPSMLNRLFTPYLWFVLAVEITGKLTSSQAGIKMPVYNIFTLVELYFYMYYLSSLQNSLRIQTLIKWATGVFFCIFLVNFLFVQGPLIYNTYTSSVASLIIIATCLLTIWNLSLYQSPGIDINIPALLIIIGITLFHSGNIVNDSFFNYMIANDPENANRLYKAINHNLNVVLYGCFAFGFVLEWYQKRKQ